MSTKLASSTHEQLRKAKGLLGKKKIIQVILDGTLIILEFYKN
jgi:hypothetical protein